MGYSLEATWPWALFHGISEPSMVFSKDPSLKTLFRSNFEAIFGKFGHWRVIVFKFRFKYKWKYRHFFVWMGRALTTLHQFVVFCWGKMVAHKFIKYVM